MASNDHLRLSKKQYTSEELRDLIWSGGLSEDSIKPLYLIVERLLTIIEEQEKRIQQLEQKTGE